MIGHKINSGKVNEMKEKLKSETINHTFPILFEQFQMWNYFRFFFCHLQSVARKFKWNSSWNFQLFITALLVVSALAENTSKSDKKHAKRGLLLGYGGYSGGYSGGLGYSSLGSSLGYSSLGYGGHGSSLGYGSHGYSSLGYSGLGHSAGYVAAAPIASTGYVASAPVAHHTHTHSIETKVVPQPYPVVQTQTRVVDRPVPVPQVSITNDSFY